MDHNFELKKRLDTIFFHIVNMPPNMREDMRKLWRPARNIWDQMDQELVTCRRINKATPKYQGLEKTLTECLENMEQLITFAALLTPNDN